jgi:2-polyprenyl-6-methoxyphenol hydroxylase-like FAD-dependent oxidoreductase
MSQLVGRQAVVIGAGIGGLTAARALADHFERVLVLEGDTLPVDVEDRAGIPQGRHVHSLLRGGQDALEALLPGFVRDLAAGGAVLLRSGLDIRVELQGFDPYPQRDLHIDFYAMSRALLELTVRRHVQAHARVEIRPRCRVQALETRDSTVTGARYTDNGGRSESVSADLVVDASGLGKLTLDTLTAMGRALPETTVIGVDLKYATALCDIPDDAPVDWKAVFSAASARRPGHGMLLMPLEGGRWIITAGDRHDDAAPADEADFLAFARELRTPTVYDAIKHAKLQGGISRYGFADSTLRHYERLRDFPRGLLPLGDAICRFNPVHGQGMSVASQEACALRRLLAERAGEPDPLGALAPAFFVEAAALIDAPWAMAAIPDFLHPKTRGQRPEHFFEIIRFRLALTKLGAQDPAVHRLNAEVQHLLRPRSVYQDPELVQRVMAMLAE